MKVLILYRPQSEHARKIEEFIRMFEMRHPDKKLEPLDVDSREGSSLARVYDTVQYPAIVATQDDGAVLKLWQGDELPLMDEVAGYL